MDHEAIKLRYAARLHELGRLPYSPAVDIEEAACRQVIEALDALAYRLLRAEDASRDRTVLTNLNITTN